jgi:small ligand-binding sensory domain FIST
MRWAAHLSENRAAAAALTEACDAVDAQLSGAPADLVFAFVSPQHADRYPRLPELLRARFPDAVLLGCSGGGVIGGGREAEQTWGLSVTAASLPGVGLVPFCLAPGEEPAPDDPKAWRERLELDPAHQPGFVLLTDPFSHRAEPTLAGLDAAFPGAPKVGGLASGGEAPGETALIFEDRLYREGAVGLALYGDVELSCVVAQGSRPFGPTMAVSRADRNLVFSLDGRPAAQCLDRAVASLSERDRVLFGRAPLVGVVPELDGLTAEPAPGDFLVRNLLGLNREAGVLGLGALVEEGQLVRFHLRDARTCAEDLDTMLSRHKAAAPSPPAGALLFSCLGRGRFLYGEEDHDSRAFKRHLGPAPLGGFFCNGEIGPVRSRTYLHGYTSSFGIFRPRGWN